MNYNDKSNPLNYQYLQGVLFMVLEIKRGKGAELKIVSNLLTVYPPYPQ